MIKMAATLKKFKNYLQNQKSYDLKLGMDYQGLKVYKVSINDGTGLILTYFMARSNLVEMAYCVDTRPRCQVSVCRTIGPLVVYW